MHQSIVLKYIVLGVASILGYGAVRVAFGDALGDVLVETIVFGLLFSLFFALYELWEKRKARKLQWLQSYEESFVVSGQNKMGKLFLAEDQFTFKGNRGRYNKVPLELSYTEITSIEFNSKVWNHQLILELKSGRIRFNFFHPEELTQCVQLLQSKMNQ